MAEELRVCLMIEGQEDVGWDHWRAIAEACERWDFDALLRSDHYVSVDDHHERGSLDAWGTVCGLAAVTERIALGTLVAIYLPLDLVIGFNAIAVFRTALVEQGKHLSSLVRPYPRTILFDLTDFALGAAWIRIISILTYAS